MKPNERHPARLGASALVLAALAAPWSGPRAQEPRPPPPEGSVPEFVEEIDVKGRRPTRSTSLEVREVRETAARDVGEALDGLAEVAKVRKAGIANDVVLRGLKKDDLAVLIDGQQLHGGCPSRMDPPAFHLDYAEVDRIEVKKGPFDVSHPGGLGGMVDVRTRGTRRPGLGTELNLNAGSFGAREASGVLGYEASGADGLLGAAYKAGQPFTSGDGRNFTLVIPVMNPANPAQRNGASYRDTSGTQTAYDVRSVWGKAGFAPAEGHRLEVSYTRQSSVDVLYPYLLMDGIADDTDRLNAQYVLGPAGVLRRGTAQVYWNRVRHDMNDRDRCSSAGTVADCSGALPRPYSMRTVARSSMLGAKLEAELEGGWLAGADFSARGWDNTTTRVARMMGNAYRDEASIPDVAVTGVGAFGQARRELSPRFTLTAGVRLDVYRSRAGIDRSALYATYRPGEDLPLSQTDLLPSGNVQLDFTAAEGATLFLGAGHGTRVPDPQERYMALAPMMAGATAWLGNPRLRPTQNDEVDLGAKYASPGLLVKAQAFHSWLTDYVSFVALGTAAGNAKTYTNVSARMYGGELTARVTLPLRLFASAGLSYTRGENDTTGGNLAEIPPLKGMVALRWDARWAFVEVEEVMAARQSRVDATISEQTTGAWAITNLRVGGAWRGVKVFAGVRNVLDRFYFEHLSYQRDPFTAGVKVPEPGRTLYVNAQYQL
jgi:iron complex outermembrane receptor protein